MVNGYRRISLFNHEIEVPNVPLREEIEVHLTPSLAGKIATQAGVRRLLLGHFYPEVLKTDITAECRKTYDGELILGRDLLHVRV